MVNFMLCIFWYKKKLGKLLVAYHISHLATSFGAHQACSLHGLSDKADLIIKQIRSALCHEKV